MDNLTDVGAERAVLAGLFQYGVDSYIEIADLIDNQSFGHANNKILFECVKRVIEENRNVDLPSILSAAEVLKFSESVNNEEELQYINSLFNFPVDKDNVITFAVTLKKLEFAKKIKKITAKIHKDIDSVNGSESIDEIVSLLEAPVMDFLMEDDGGEKPEMIGEGASEYLVSARPKVGKSVFADNVALNVASDGVPVLVLDTEMSKEDHLNRIIANLSNVPINDVATGKFVDDDEKHEKVFDAVEHIESIPYSYVSVAGKPFEQILNIIKRWIMQEVKMDENGKTNECVVVYDYLKLMSSNSITNNIQEYQALGFQITALHNLCVKYDFPCLSFVQLNRDGITKESTDAVSGSDRLIWLCTSFSIFKLKSPEELAEDGPQAGNRKLVPIVSRHGAGLDDGDYINMNMLGEYARLVELRTRNEFRLQPVGDTGLISDEDLGDINNGLEETEEYPI